jgi:hypothetical protein
LETPTRTNALSQGCVGAISHPPGTNATHLYWAVAPTGTNVRHLHRIIASPGTNMYAPVTLDFSKSHGPFLPSYLMSVPLLLPPSPSLVLISSYSHTSLSSSSRDLDQGRPTRCGAGVGSGRRGMGKRGRPECWREETEGEKFS